MKRAYTIQVSEEELLILIQGLHFGISYSVFDDEAQAGKLQKALEELEAGKED